MWNGGAERQRPRNGEGDREGKRYRHSERERERKEVRELEMETDTQRRQGDHCGGREKEQGEMRRQDRATERETYGVRRRDQERDVVREKRRQAKGQ